MPTRQLCSVRQTHHLCGDAGGRGIIGEEKLTRRVQNEYGEKLKASNKFLEKPLRKSRFNVIFKSMKQNKWHMLLALLNKSCVTNDF